MRLCALCKTRYQKGSGISFHRFPSDSSKQLWLDNINIENWSPKYNAELCSKHFTQDCFIKNVSRTTLKRGSVPKIFCEASTSGSLEHGKISIDDSKILGEASTSVTPISCQKIKCENIPCRSEVYDDHFRLDEASTSVTPISCKKIKCENISCRSDVYDDNYKLDEASTSGTLLPCKNMKYESSPCRSDIYDENYKLDEASTSVTLAPCKTIKCENTPCRSVVYDDNNELSEASTSITPPTCKMIKYENTPCRRVSEVCANIKHDHLYESTPKSTNKVIQRLKESLRTSRAREKVLSQHVKRLKSTVSFLKTRIKDLEKRN